MAEWPRLPLIASLTKYAGESLTMVERTVKSEPASRYFGVRTKTERAAQWRPSKLGDPIKL